MLLSQESEIRNQLAFLSNLSDDTIIIALPDKVGTKINFEKHYFDKLLKEASNPIHIWGMENSMKVNYVLAKVNNLKNSVYYNSFLQEALKFHLTNICICQ